jgi:2-polyprenyl-3-methyl-5-hydroxy-6-metoxy-1,4-benzoquinol methylase
MWHVLEHVHALHNYLSQINKLLKPGGRLFVAVPNYTSADAKLYKEFWAAYDVPRHLYHFSPASMKTLLQKHGMKLTGIKPMWYDSFYVSMLSEQYKNGSSNIVQAFGNGLFSNFKALSNAELCSSLIYIVSKNL